jgi:hypothetical protein
MLHRHASSHAALALLTCLAAFITGAAQAQSRPSRVASLNLCTDQLVLALADRSQILSLSRLAQDTSISFLADQAAGLPMNDGSAETILFERPDLVLTGTYGQQEQIALLRGQALEVLSLGPWADLEDGRGQIRTLARRLGHPDRGEALIARIDAALERARGIVPVRRSILVYERGGWVMALHSPLNEILVRASRNHRYDAAGFHARRCGFKPGGRQWYGALREPCPCRGRAPGSASGTAWPAHDLRRTLDACRYRHVERRGAGQVALIGTQAYSSRSCRGGAGLRRIGQPAATKTTASQASAIR